MSAHTKPKSLAIDPALHRYLKLLTALDNVQMNELTEPVLWQVVQANRDRLERMLEEPITIPQLPREAVTA